MKQFFAVSKVKLRASTSPTSMIRGIERVDIDILPVLLDAAE
jgi:hypothetical protein